MYTIDEALVLVMIVIDRVILRHFDELEAQLCVNTVLEMGINSLKSFKGTADCGLTR